MNLMLFETPFESIHLVAADVRAVHLRKVLRLQLDALVFIGFVNGERGRARVVCLDEDGGVGLQVVATEQVANPLPVTLLLALPRPHTAKRILFEAASLGVSAIHFFESEQGEPSYAQSRLWKTDEWRQRLRLGAEQAFTTHLPQVAMHADQQSALSVLPPAGVHVALDNYEAEGPLSQLLPAGAPSVLIALGAERGWSANERDVFRKNGWRIAHLGAHVLRAETACVAAVSVVAAQLDFWQGQTETQL
jgi:16S rRNA (uracil1498-N3)-methyltransferase